jgi:hypothetical protein
MFAEVKGFAAISTAGMSKSRRTLRPSYELRASLRIIIFTHACFQRDGDDTSTAPPDHCKLQ